MREFINVESCRLISNEHKQRFVEFQTQLADSLLSAKFLGVKENSSQKL